MNTRQGKQEAGVWRRLADRLADTLHRAARPGRAALACGGQRDGERPLNHGSRQAVGEGVFHVGEGVIGSLEEV